MRSGSWLMSGRLSNGCHQARELQVSGQASNVRAVCTNKLQPHTNGVGGDRNDMTHQYGEWKRCEEAGDMRLGP